MEHWMAKDPFKKFHLPKRMSTDEGEPARFPVNVFTRPISALARHRVHQLSDIHETSASSRILDVESPSQAWLDGMSKDRPQTPTPQNDALSFTASTEYLTPSTFRQAPQASALGSRAASAISLPHRVVPERKSSRNILARSLGGSAHSLIRNTPTWKIPELDGTNAVVPDRGRAHSPVRRSIHRAAQSSEILRPSLARTFVRTSPQHETLDQGSSRHPRLDVSVTLPSPLFVGGGTVEGQLNIRVDGGVAQKPKFKPIYMSKTCVDIIGVEEISDGRRWVFLSLATELVDKDNPPPPSLVTSQQPQPGSDLWWEMKPATSVLPFCVNLPLKLGPPPYASKHASIRYLLCPSIVIKTGDKTTVLRQTWNIQMLTVHDPEKALASLPSPLLASDTLYLVRDTDLQAVKLTAGLHRQTWVNGAMIFIDVHITNTTSRSIKKIEVQLEKTTLWYAHTAAGTAEKSVSYLRLPKRTDTEVVGGTTLKKSSAWKGIPSHSSDVRTIELQAPRGHVTVSTGRFFEVRYFIKVVVTLKMFKTVAVQLPVTIIPLNSLDIPPNSLRQVAASIEAKRAKTVPVPPSDSGKAAFRQGQAFEIPVRRSLDRARLERPTFQTDLNGLAAELENSPRRLAHTHNHSKGGTGNHPLDENIPLGGHVRPLASHHHLERHASCYHCHIAPENNTPANRQGPRLPRLQVSTSGLGFSESEFEVPADSPPRKVMLSEEERNMIKRQRELQDRQEQTQGRTAKSSLDLKPGDIPRPSKDLARYNNVVADANVVPKQPEVGNLSPGGVRKRSNTIKPKDVRLPAGGITVLRSRSKTNPEGPQHRASVNKPSRRPNNYRQKHRGMSVDGPAYAPFPRLSSRDMDPRGGIDQLF